MNAPSVAATLAVLIRNVSLHYHLENGERLLNDAMTRQYVVNEGYAPIGNQDSLVTERSARQFGTY